MENLCLLQVILSVVQLSINRTTIIQTVNDVPVVVQTAHNSQQLRSSMICYGAPDHNSGCSFTVAFNNALWKVAFTGIASHTNAAIMVPQIKAGFIKKHGILPISIETGVLISSMSCFLTNPATICGTMMAAIVNATFRSALSNATVDEHPELWSGAPWTISIATKCGQSEQQLVHQ